MEIPELQPVVEEADRLLEEVVVVVLVVVVVVVVVVPPVVVNCEIEYTLLPLEQFVLTL